MFWLDNWMFNERGRNMIMIFKVCYLCCLILKMGGVVVVVVVFLVLMVWG